MRIRKPNRLQVLVVILVAAFFGYMGYRDLIFDASAAVQTKLDTKLAEQKPADGQTSPEFFGLKRAEIALAEYRKNVVETKHGCNCGPEIEKYTEGNHAQWCTMFASWVANQSGSGVWSEKNQSWRIANSREFAAYLQQNGTWYSREQVINEHLQPRIGDFIVFWRGKFEDNLGHVDVVVDLGNGNGAAGLVGGNLKDRVQFRENFPYLQHYGFLGFGRPEKE